MYAISRINSLTFPLSQPWGIPAAPKRVGIQSVTWNKLANQDAPCQLECLEKAKFMQTCSKCPSISSAWESKLRQEPVWGQFRTVHYFMYLFFPLSPCALLPTWSSCGPWGGRRCPWWGRSKWWKKAQIDFCNITCFCLYYTSLVNTTMVSWSRPICLSLSIASEIWRSMDVIMALSYNVSKLLFRHSMTIETSHPWPSASSLPWRQVPALLCLGTSACVALGPIYQRWNLQLACLLHLLVSHLLGVGHGWPAGIGRGRRVSLGTPWQCVSPG